MARAILERDLRRAKGELPLNASRSKQPSANIQSSPAANTPTPQEQKQQVQPVASTSQASVTATPLTTSPETMISRTPPANPHLLEDLSGSAKSAGQSPAKLTLSSALAQPQAGSSSSFSSDGGGLKPTQLEMSKEGLSPSVLAASFDQSSKSSSSTHALAADSTLDLSVPPAASSSSAANPDFNALSLDFNDPASLEALLSAFPAPNTSSSASTSAPSATSNINFANLSAPFTSSSPVSGAPANAATGAGGGEDTADFLRTLGLSGGLSPFPAAASSSSSAPGLHGLGLTTSVGSTSIPLPPASAGSDTIQLDSLLGIDSSLSGTGTPVGILPTSSGADQSQTAASSGANGSQNGSGAPVNFQDLDLDSLLATFGS